MNNFERVRDLVNNYVAENGTETEMTRAEFLEWVHQTYENISAAKNNLYPTDISYNLYNAGLKDFPGPNLCLVYVEERDTFKLVGTGYKHTGPIWQYKGKSNETVVGHWSDGVCQMGKNSSNDMHIPEEIINRRDELLECVKYALESIPVNVLADKTAVLVKFQELLICGINVEEHIYKIYNASSEWADQTSYLCEEAKDGTWLYYLETIDECIGEVQRLVQYESQRSSKTKVDGTREIILDVADGKEYNAIFEAINDAVGTDYTGWMKACWPNHEGNGNFRIWFPKLAKMKEGKPVTNASGCVNYLADDDEQMVYDDLNKRDVEGAAHFTDYDLIFAKDYNGPYKFRGVFIRDEEASSLNHHVSRRIATRVKVIGCPAERVEILADQVGDEHRALIENILTKLSAEEPAITYKTDSVKHTPVFLNGERVLGVYYRKGAVRVDVKLNSKQHAIYNQYLADGLAYQKDSADPMSTSGAYAFFVDDENVEAAFRKLLMNLG